MSIDGSQAVDLAYVRQIRAGDEHAKEQLIEKYMPMVRHIVQRHCASFLELDDLLQEGLIGLLGAIRAYRPDRFDAKFSTFAYMCITRKVYNALKQNNGNKHKALNRAVSLHRALHTEGTRTVMDVTTDDQVGDDPFYVIERSLAEERIDRVLRRHLSTLEYKVIVLIVDGYACGEIAELIGVNSKAVDNARTRVKAKLEKIIAAYGSLHNPGIPMRVRKRRDLYRRLPTPRGAFA